MFFNKYHCIFILQIAQDIHIVKAKMDDNKKSNGKGRGSLLLQMMKEKTQAERARSEALSHSVETPSFSSSEQTRSFEASQSSFASSVSVGRGRAQLPSLLKSMSISKGLETRGPTQAMGRASLLSSLTKRQE